MLLYQNYVSAKSSTTWADQVPVIRLWDSPRCRIGGCYLHWDFRSFNVPSLFSWRFKLCRDIWRLSTNESFFIHPLFSQAVSTLTDLLRDNLKKSKMKRFVLPALGEFLYLIASQVESAYDHQYINLFIVHDVKCAAPLVHWNPNWFQPRVGVRKQSLMWSSFALSTSCTQSYKFGPLSSL